MYMSKERKILFVIGLLMIIYAVYFLFFYRGGIRTEDLFTNVDVVVLLAGVLMCSTVFFKEY